MAEIRSPKLIITGTTGFLGRRLLARLKMMNHEQVYATALHENVPLAIHKLDLLDFKVLQETISKIKPSVVYHLAAIVNLERDYNVAQSCIDINIKGTLNLLESFKKHKPNKLIFISSEEVYGDGPMPFSENQLTRPPSPYSVSKIAAENFCDMYARELGFSLIIFRVATMYGPENHVDRFLSKIILSALENKEIPLNSGRKKRDYVFVDDVVDALISAENRKLKNLTEVINLGGAGSYSLMDVAKRIVQLSKSKSRILTGAFPDRVLEAQEWLLDISKAKKLLNWKPKTSLEKGLKKTIEHYR